MVWAKTKLKLCTDYADYTDKSSAKIRNRPSLSSSVVFQRVNLSTLLSKLLSA
jgi:hypothetical protein